MWRLLYPLRYFGLVNATKGWLDALAIPLSALLAAPFWLFPNAIFFSAGGFLDKILALTSALAGFYVAALVAAATFAHPDLDRVITIGPVYERRSYDGVSELEPLTRREFACVIFGYLSFGSLLYTLCAAIAVTTAGPALVALEASTAAKILTPESLPWISGAMVFAFTLPLAHLAVATGLGLYYLMERLHTREPRVLAKKDDHRAA